MKTQKLLSVLITLAMVISLLPMTVSVSAQDTGSLPTSVAFMYYDRDAKAFINTRCPNSCTPVTSTTSPWTTGWYVASGSVYIAGRVSVTGDVKLILKDGCSLTIQYGISVEQGNSLTVYGQSAGTGELICSYLSDTDATIGGSYLVNGGTITIAGGRVTATNRRVAVIGGSGAAVTVLGGSLTTNNGTNGISGRTVTISGGTVATQNIVADTITINDGKITSQNITGNVTVNGGEIEARGGVGTAGIGGGTVTINDGKIKAFGEVAGIGGRAHGGITINGGEIEAHGGGAGIGGGFGTTSGTIIITGGKIDAFGGGDSAGIGAGGGGSSDRGGDITISGGVVTASGNAAGVPNGGPGIGGRSCNLTISGGTITANAGNQSTAYSVGAFNVDNAVQLVDCSNGTYIVKEDEQDWKDVFVGGSYSICALPHSVPYLAYDTETNSFTEEECEYGDYQLFNGNEPTLQDGTYVVCGSREIAQRISISGNVRLILTDGCNLTASDSIIAESGKSLTIYAQSDGETVGALHVNGKSSVPGISVGTLTINGGKIEAAGGESDGAGIDNTGTVTVYGGIVTAKGGKWAAGIGGGQNSNGGTVNIYGGTVNATGGDGGAGIGGGESKGGNGGTVNICGGTVNATGRNGGAGLGGGLYGNDGTVNICGGTVNATGENGGTGIGGTVNICGGTVNATGENGGAGIGGTLTVSSDMIVINNETELVITASDISGCPSVSIYESNTNDRILYREYDDGAPVTKIHNKADFFELTNPLNDAVCWEDGWYLIDSENVNFNMRITVLGDVKLILKDGCKLTVPKGIFVGKDGTLTIYGQAEGTGKLIASLGRNVSYCAAIGGGETSGSTNNCDCGVVNIHGGTIDVKGGLRAAGIGGGKGGSSGTVNIYGGSINAEGGTSSAGIGGGEEGTGGTVNIYGGTITAESGTMGAGIGSGNGGAGVTVNISGGTVTAFGTEASGGAGIGGSDGVAGTITISGGKVTATGDFSAAGIGCGCFGSCGDIIISGGDVTAIATGGAAGIGADFIFKGGNVSIYNDAAIHAMAEGTAGIKAGTVTVYPNSEHEVIHIKQNDADINGSPFTQTTEIGSLLGNGNVEALSETVHRFTVGSIDNGDGTHSRQCAYCDTREEAKEAHRFTSSVCMDNGDGTHLRKCMECDKYSEPEVHTPDGVYRSNGGGAHSQKCLYCGAYVSIEEHTFADDDSCTVCGSTFARIELEDGTVIRYESDVFEINENGVLTKYNGTASTVVIPEGVKQIGSNAFCANNVITEVTIPASVEVVGDKAFYLSGLTAVTFEEGSHLTTIGYSAFREAQLTSFTVPASVKTIGGSSIGGMRSMTELIFEEGSQLETVGDWAFSTDSLTTVSIPKTVKAIGIGAFGNMNFTSVCVNWETASEIVAPASDFSGASYSGGTLYVPFGTRNLYASHEFWGKFRNIVEMEPETDMLSLTVTGNSFSVTARGTDVGTGIVTVALYDSEDLNRLLDVKVFELTKTNDLTGTFTQDGYVRAYWWTGFDTMIPLCKPADGTIAE